MSLRCPNDCAENLLLVAESVETTTEIGMTVSMRCEGCGADGLCDFAYASAENVEWNDSEDAVDENDGEPSGSDSDDEE